MGHSLWIVVLCLWTWLTSGQTPGGKGNIAGSVKDGNALAGAITGGGAAPQGVVPASGLLPGAAGPLPGNAPGGKSNKGIKSVKVKGIVTNLINGNLVMTANHAAKAGKPAYTSEETYVLTPATQYQLVQGKNTAPAAPGALRAGQKVTVYVLRTTPPQAEAVDIQVSTKSLKVKGMITRLVNGNVVVNVTHRARAGKPAYTALETYTLTPATQYQLVQGKNSLPAKLSALRVGQEVTIYASSITPLQADAVDIHVPKTSSKSPSKKK
jgi:hypothetical protein